MLPDITGGIFYFQPRINRKIFLLGCREQGKQFVKFIHKIFYCGLPASSRRCARCYSQNYRYSLKLSVIHSSFLGNDSSYILAIKGSCHEGDVYKSVTNNWLTESINFERRFA
jgi:hypothetical protein